MKKLKKFYQNNRIYCILMIISIFCLVSIGAGVATYFIRQAMLDNYGNRLDGIKEYDVSSDLEALEKFYDEQKIVSKKIRLQGKIIYIDVNVEKNTKLEDIENMATLSLEKISSKNQTYYDIQFMFMIEDGVPYMGSKSSANQTISWNNYKVDTEETTTTKKK